MFHLCPLPKRFAAFHRPTCRPQLDQQWFLRMYTERAPACRRGTVRLQQTAPAGIGGKLRSASRALQTHRHSRGARHLVTIERDPKRFFAKAAPVAQGPGLSENGDALGLERTNQRATQVGPVNGEGLDLAMSC